MMTSFELLYWLSANGENKTAVSLHYEARFRYALAALVVLEMLLDKNIQWNDEKQLVGLPAHPPTDDLLREVWELCTIPKKINWYWRTGKRQTTALTVKDWLDVMAGGHIAIFDKVKARLAEKNILKIEQKRFLGIIQYKTSRIASDAERLAYQTKLQNIVLGTETPTLQEFVLLKVIKACKIHSLISNTTKTKDQQEWLKALTIWNLQKVENDAIVEFLNTLDFEKDLGELSDILDTLTDVVNTIADAIDVGADGGGDGGGDGGD